MQSTSSISALAANSIERFQAMRQQHDTKQKQSEANDNNSIELPAAIKNLTTGNDYWVTAKTNRYKKLIREGHVNDLLELAKLAPVMATKADPSHWFAASASVKQWERSQDFLQKLRRLYIVAAQVLARLGAQASVADRLQKLVYKQIWLKRSVERHATAAQELPHNKPNQSRAKLFAYLCRLEGQGTTAQNAA